MVGVLYDDTADIFDLGKGDLDLDFVVREGDEGEGETLLQEVLIEEEGDLNEEFSLLGGELNITGKRLLDVPSPRAAHDVTKISRTV